MDSWLSLPSERLAHHLVGFSFELRQNGFAAKPTHWGISEVNNNNRARRLKSSFLRRTNYKGTSYYILFERVLKYKRGGAAPHSKLVLINLAIDIVKTVRSIVENFGDDEGALPSRGKLVWFLLIHSKN